MRQIILTHLPGTYGTGQSIAPIWGNNPQVPGNFHLIATPWAAPGVLRELLITDDVDGAVWTLYVNHLPTALTATSMGGIAVNLINSVRMAIGDIAYYLRDGAIRWVDLELPLNASMAFDSDDDVTSVYGCHADPTKASAGALGALGPSGVPSNTVSLSPMAGRLIRVVAYANFDQIDAANELRYTTYKTLAGTSTPIAQDGSGGTVDTRISLFATQLGEVVFPLDTNLPFAEGDLLEVRVEAFGTVGFHHTAGFGTAVAAATPGQFAFCGSMQTGQDNFTAGNAYGSLPGRWDTVEYAIWGSANRGAVTTFNVTGLQAWNRGGYPALTDPTTLAMWHNGGAPANQPTITMDPGEVWIVDTDPTHVVSIAMGDRWSTQSFIATSVGLQVHWSYRAYVDLPPVPLPAGCPAGMGLQPVSGQPGCDDAVVTAPLGV